MGLGGTLNPNGTSPPKRERERESESNRGECLWREWVSGHMVVGCQMVWSIYTSNESIPFFSQ